MKIVCPKCGTEHAVGTEHEENLVCPSCAELLDVAAFLAATCPVCGSGFEEGDTVRVCPDCKTPHHDECWAENRGCSTYGCGSAAHQETHTSGDAPAGPDGDAGLVDCPACGAMHPATDLVCGACGKLLGDALPGGPSVASRLRETTGRLGGAAKAHLFPRLARNFRLLGRDLGTVFRIWWGEFSRYARFSGVTSRPSYVAFCAVNAAVAWLFGASDAEPLVVLAFVVLFLPTLSASVRRLRDTDVSPWLVFAFPLLPFLLFVPTVREDTDAETTTSDGAVP